MDVDLDCEESWALKNWCFWTVVLEKTLESPLDCISYPTSPFWRRQSWVFIGRTDAKAETSTLATSCEELTHLKRPWWWERLGAGGERDDRGWDGWMALSFLMTSIILTWVADKFVPYEGFHMRKIKMWKFMRWRLRRSLVLIKRLYSSASIGQ